jgi:hypothetical protein
MLNSLQTANILPSRPLVRKAAARKKAMLNVANLDKRDRRDKRFIAPRRRVKLPWFFLACLIVLIGFAFLAKRVAPRLGGNAPAAHSAEGGGSSSSPQSTDW